MHTSAAHPSGRDATTPARTRLVFPAPDGAITASSRRFRSRPHSAPTSASRPKKSPASSSVKLISPGYGSRSPVS